MFQFKQFNIEDSSSPMKVGTDAVLLGAWMPTKNNNPKVLDIGTGCGVISLMMAQRMPHAEIHAIDIDNGAWIDAQNNFQNSIWNNRLNIITPAPIQDFTKENNEKFDIIVSNPPFFIDSFKCNKTSRNLARHNDSLSFTDLIACINSLLTDDGFFAGILPFNEGSKFIDLANSENLFCFKKTLVADRPDKEYKRILFCLSKHEAKDIDTSSLYIRNNDRSYSNEYLELTKDFYTFIP